MSYFKVEIKVYHRGETGTLVSEYADLDHSQGGQYESLRACMKSQVDIVVNALERKFKDVQDH